MLFAISGTQSTGKTTVLKELQNRGYNVIHRKTARSILDDWNISLHDINADPELTIKFQNEIIDRKYQDELIAHTSKDVWFTERSFADPMTYLVSSVGILNKYDTQINEYFDKCLQYQQHYDCVYLLLPGNFPIENDGVRNLNVHYARMVELLMQDYVNKMSKRYMRISSNNVNSKINYILEDVFHGQ